MVPGRGADSGLWTLGYQRVRESALVDDVLLAAGRALHLANAFEVKCSHVLRMANMAAVSEDDPVAALEEVISRVPADKMLAGTLHDLARHFTNPNTADIDALNKARLARNFIAHEGAGFGYISSIGRRELLKHAVRLRDAVADLARGDNVISLWCFHINEPREPAPTELFASYPEMVDHWVFGHLTQLLDDYATGKVPDDPSARDLLREHLRNINEAIT